MKRDTIIENAGYVGIAAIILVLILLIWSQTGCILEHKVEKTTTIKTLKK